MNIRQILRPSLQQGYLETERKPKKKTSSTVSGRNADRLTLSKQALAYLEEQNRLVWEKKTDEEDSSPLSKLEKDRKKQEKCFKIAARLRNGDMVPQEDLQYLAENDPAFYLLALSQRRENPDPREWESVLDEEDRESMSAESSGDMASMLGGSDGSGMDISGGSEI